MKKTILVLLLLLPIVNFGQAGSLDNSFDNVGAGLNGAVITSALQSDGKIIVGGAFTYYDVNSLTSRNRIARLNSNGSLDTSFNPGSGADNTVNSLCLQPDGKIIIAGSFSNFNGISAKCITRLNANGTLDTSFDAGTGPNYIINSISLQSDGKIIVGGSFTSFNTTTSHKYLVRLNADGSLDSSFNPSGTGVSGGTVYKTIIQPDGKIIYHGGSFYNGIACGNIVRLNINGTIDSGFNSGGTGVSSSNPGNLVNSIKLQSNGKILIGGSFYSYNGVSHVGIVRLNIDGSEDGTYFAISNISTSNNVRNIIVENDGKIIANVGSVFNRYYTNGDIDQNFICTITSSSNSPAISTSLIQPDGKIIIAGYFSECYGVAKSNVARINTTSAGDVFNNIDLTFNNTGTGMNNAIITSVLQNDGKIIVGGTFTNYNVNSTISRNYIARINPNGLLDATFDPGLGFDNQVQTLAIQPNGKIIVAGYFSNFNGISRNRIARLNPDGSLDATFNPLLGANAEVFSVVLQPNGKIIVAGNFSAFNNDSSKKFICRLNQDGSIDTSFNITGTGLDYYVRTVSLQTDGKIIIGGYFTNYDGINKNKVARLNSDGSIDTSFNSGSGPNGLVRTSTIDANGKVLIAGDFSNINGISSSSLARLNTDGTLDATYNIPYLTYPDTGTIYTILIKPDGNLILVGNWTNPNGQHHAILGGVNFDTPMVGTAAYTGIYLPDGNLIIGGDFTTINGMARNKIAKLFVNSGLATSTFDEENSKAVIAYPNPVQNIFHIDFDKEFTGSLFDITGKYLMNITTKDIDLSSLSAGLYILDILSEGKRYTKKIIKE